MKARVIATGKIVEVSMECNNSTDYRKAIFRTKDGMSYRYDDVELIFDKITARVKSTGDIFEVSDMTTIYPEHYDKSYNITEVDFLDVEVMNNPCHNPDYWTRLEHQYAGMAMQGLMSILPQIGGIEGRSKQTEVVDISFTVAHALVEKYKKEEK